MEAGAPYNIYIYPINMAWATLSTVEKHEKIPLASDFNYLNYCLDATLEPTELSEFFYTFDSLGLPIASTQLHYIINRLNIYSIQRSGLDQIYLIPIYVLK